MGAYRDFARSGGLMSCRRSGDAYRRVGYARRAFSGCETPSDLLVAQSTRVAFVLNLSTSNAFGLKVPLQLLSIADEVVE
jgi:hypothetical protein